MNREEVTEQYFDLRSCKNKRTYLKKSEAKAAARIMKHKSDRGRLRAYSCRYCPHYHIGHNRLAYEDRVKHEQYQNILKNAI